jgi:hypothetical protein
MTWLAWHPLVINFLTHLCIVWEISYCALVWRPRLRPLVLAGAVLLHAGIGYCLGMWTFALIMMVGNASFLPPNTVRGIIAALVPTSPPSLAPSPVTVGVSAARLGLREATQAALVPMELGR